MDNSFPFSFTTVLSLAATYWLHSTILIGGVWCLLRVCTGCSHALRDRLWKFSAVAAIVTTGIQMTVGLGIPLLPASPASRVESDSDDLSPGSPMGSHRIVSSLRIPATADQSMSLVRESLDRLQDSASGIEEPHALTGTVVAAQF